MASWTTTLPDLRLEVVGTARGPIFELARAGHGPALLCVHGIPGSWRQLVPLAEDLVDRFEVIMPSRSGYGRTPIRSGRTYDEQADGYAALLDALGIERCSIVGVSGGGPSAVAFAGRHSERCDALILLCALAPHLVTPPRAWKLFDVPLLAELVMPPLRAASTWRARQSRERVDVVLSRGLTADERARADGDQRIRDDLLRHVLAHQESPAGVAGLRNDYRQIKRFRQAPGISVTCPTLIAHGTADRTVPLDHARFYEAAIPGAELKVFEEAGHLFVVTRRRETVAAIRDFLSD